MRQPLNTHGCSLRIYGDSLRAVDLTIQTCLNWFASIGIPTAAVGAAIESGQQPAAQFQLLPEYAEAWLPNSDTLELARRLGLASQQNPADLEQEILVAMLGSPIPFEFPSCEEFESAVRIRKNIVEAARKTRLAFGTKEAERPEDCWEYVDGRGFLVLPGTSLIEALRKATQPDQSGRLFSFSCYRATEYVIVLGIAQELAIRNPGLLVQLQQQAETRAIMSGEFHRVFLREYGSRTNPLPPRYYVPGDRLWFRNPDHNSSDASGFEGSWVFYLGSGLFSNFWKQDKTFTLTTKCVEIYHWRHGAYRDAQGEMRMDESIVDRLVESTLLDPNEVARILTIMARPADPSGVYADGGCIDLTREYPQLVCPGTADLRLPDVDAAPKPVRRTDASLQPHA